MKIYNVFLKCLLLSVLILTCHSCEKDDFDYDYDYDNIVTDNISAPSFDKYLTTTDYDGFSIRLRFTNGGDKRENMSCYVYWKAYASKPASTPKERDLTNCESMRIYSHNSAKTTFDKSHAGYNGGTYIYYYAVCENSKGECKTKVNYTIVKR